MDWKVGKYMEYKIENICNDLGIGKSTLYLRLKSIKEKLSPEELKNNDYFYYNDKNRLFIKQKGYEFIRDFTKTDNKTNQKFNTDIVVYKDEMIKIYQERIRFLENENKKLLDIIAFKEQKELANSNIQYIESNNNKSSFFEFIFSKFKK